MDENYADAIYKLLAHAEEDLKAAKVLYENELMLQSVYHLEQASEKILKAYLIGVLIYPMKFAVDVAENVSTAEKFRDVHIWLKRAVYNYLVPKKLGHDFSGFLKDFLPRLYKAYCSGRLIAYVNATLRSLFSRVKMSKEHIIVESMKQGVAREVAEKLYNLIIHVLSQLAPTTIGEDIRRKFCEKAKLDFVSPLEKLSKEEKPCLQVTTLFVEYAEEVAERVYNEVISEYGEFLSRKTREVLEAVDLVDILSQRILEETVEGFLRSVTVDRFAVYMMLPLHFCLLKYYHATRYGEGTVPEEEFETIPHTIKTLSHIHGITKNLTSLSLQE